MSERRFDHTSFRTLICDEPRPGVARITLNRPAQMNAYNFEMTQELLSAIAAYRDDDSLKALILTGAGTRAFCTGGDISGSERSARTALEANPGDAASAHFLATLLCRTERFVEALPLLQSAVLQEPDNATFRRDLGVVQLFLGDTELARASLHRALALDPHVDSVLTTLGAKISAHPFKHGVAYDVGKFKLISSYHCSRYNTNTGRLTTAMFEDVVGKAKALASR